jgi:hypothetical protein
MNKAAVENFDRRFVYPHAKGEGIVKLDSFY